jgi:hypothetical protein
VCYQAGDFWTRDDRRRLEKMDGFASLAMTPE